MWPRFKSEAVITRTEIRFQFWDEREKISISCIFFSRQNGSYKVVPLIFHRDTRITCKSVNFFLQCHECTRVSSNRLGSYSQSETRQKAPKQQLEDRTCSRKVIHFLNSSKAYSALHLWSLPSWLGSPLHTRFRARSGVTEASHFS